MYAHMRPAHLLAAALLATSTATTALADETYIGTNANWSSNSSWSNNAVPTSADNVFVTPFLASGTNTLTADDRGIQTANLTIGATGNGTAVLAAEGGNTAAITILSTGEFEAGSTYTTGSILNQGLITTESLGSDPLPGMLRLQANATLTNQGTISTQNAGLLNFTGNNTLLDNTNGTINATGYNANNSVYGSILFNNFNISGGQLYASQYNRITLNGGSLSNATVNGDLQVWGNSVLFANDTINGNLPYLVSSPSAPIVFAGALAISGTWNASSVQISGPVSLNGNGTFNLGIQIGSFPNFAALNANASLSIASSQTLNLSAFFGPMPLTNAGTVLGNSTFYIPAADSSGTPLFLNRGNLTASALLGANTTIGAIDNTNGTISIAGTQSTPPHTPNILTLQNVNITGGTLLTDAKAQIQLGRTDTLSNLTMAGNFSLTKNANFTLTLSNVILNGTLTANANVTSTTALTGNGTLILAANASLSSGPLQLTAATLSGSAQIRAASGTSILHTLTLTSPGSLDLTTNALILTDPTAKPSIQSDIAARSLFSSIAPLVLIDNSALVTPYTTFAGQSVNPATLLIAPARPGDATLDGTVDLNDLNTVLNHLGQSTTNWTDGNFDGQPTIDLNDLNAVLNHLGATSPNSSAILAAESLLATATPTPEPSTLMLSAAAPLAVLARRRRNLSKQSHHASAHVS